MNWYDNREECEKRGIDYDLAACWEFNQPNFEFNLDDIEQVLAVWEGENDGDDWRWVVRLTNGKYGFIQGGCDYTGWDCVSSAATAIVESADEAINKTTESYCNDQIEEVKMELKRQIETVKNTTQGDRIESINEDNWKWFD